MNNVERVLDIVADVIKRRVEPDDNLESHGLDSLGMMHLMVQLEQNYSIEFVDNDLRKTNFNSVYNICKLLEGKLINYRENGRGLLFGTPISKSERKINCVLRGGCDLRRTEPFLSLEANLNIQPELTYVSSKGVIIRNDHLEILKNSLILTDEKKQQQINNIPFYDDKIFTTDIFDSNCDVVIVSMLHDYYSGLYRNKQNKDLITAFGDYSSPFSDIENWHAQFERKIADQYWEGRVKINDEKMSWFHNNFEFIGGVDRDYFVNQLNWLRQNLNPNTILIFMNGSNIDLKETLMLSRAERHKKMNSWLEEAITFMPNTYLIDVNKYIETENDLNDTIGHYRRDHYKHIAHEITKLIEEKYKNIKLTAEK